MIELRLYLQSHKMGWPFLEPVEPSEVPDYYNIIKDPMGKSNNSVYYMPGVVPGPSLVVAIIQHLCVAFHTHGPNQKFLFCTF